MHDLHYTVYSYRVYRDNSCCHGTKRFIIFITKGCRLMLMSQGTIQLNPIPINMLLPLHIEALYLKQSKTDNTADYVTYLVTTLIITLFHSFHCHVQNATIPYHSQELLPFPSVMYFFLSPFSTNYSSILSHLILPSISWSTSQSCCLPNSYKIPFWEFYFLTFSVHAQTNIVY